MSGTRADRAGFDRRTGFSFVGREAELSSLLAACREGPAVVFVEGEAGVGKSRLLHEAETVLRSVGTPVLRGVCHPLREPLPLGPAIDALRTGRQLLAPGTQLGPATAHLAPLLPELADFLAPNKPDLGETSFQQVMPRAVHEVLSAMGPVVLIVEDIHWADAATRDLLSLLARNPPNGLRLLLTYRAADLPGAGNLLGAPYRRPLGVGGTEIVLSPLSETQTRRLASSALGAAATEPLCRELFERSGGLPLAAEEDLLVLAARLARGDDSLPPLEATEVPRALQEAVGSRIDPLSKDARAVVEAAAVTALPVASQELLTVVAGLPEERAEQALTEALEAHVLTEAEAGRYAFRHGLARRAVYGRIPGPRRRRLHARAVDALRAQPNPALVQIAHHAYRLGDAAAWLPTALAAAEHASAVGDDGVAADLLQQLLAEPTLPPGDRGRCALSLSAIAMFRTDPTATEAILRRIVADPALDAPIRGEIRLNLARALATTNVYWDSRAELEQAITELEGRPGPAATALASLSLGSLMNAEGGNVTESLTIMDRAVRLAAAAADDGAVQAHVLGSRITLFELVGDPRGRELLAQLPRASTDRSILLQCARALHDASYFEMARGCDPLARALLDEAEELCLRTASSYLGLSCRAIRLHLDLVDGRWDGLEQRIEEIHQGTADSTARAGSLLARATLDVARGRWVRARGDLAPLAEAYGVEIGPLVMITLARLDLLEGDHQAAWQRLAPVTEVMRRKGLWTRPVGLLPTAVEAALGCGLADEARRLTEDAQQGIEGRIAPGATADVACSRGMLAADTDPAAALGHLESARAQYEAIGRLPTAARVAERMGRLKLVHQHHRLDEACRDLQEAHVVFTRMGATVDAARCEQALRDSGRHRPAPRGRRGYGTDLSPRERQVAELLAGGATNHDIALALSLSPRTAEHHVAKTLKKLAVTRAQVRDVWDSPRE
ncbi:ATP-binding protein [Streptomyces sp. MSC1_001]|jgi:DNA-binding CsgD family transcriptional regulator|uniref:ATP-binding protein n=1 Tax=Streptomyces sp. MSC1_001 TaxID=2909263 RepID=UPI0020303BC1|nr:LuxR family transcriptional regulator [Streptomyces sp. MSC1_001]